MYILFLISPVLYLIEELARHLLFPFPERSKRSGNRKTLNFNQAKENENENDIVNSLDGCVFRTVGTDGIGCGNSDSGGLGMQTG